MPQLESDDKCYYCQSRRQVVWTQAFGRYMCCTCRQLVTAYFLNYKSFDDERILPYLRLHGVTVKLAPTKKEGEDIG